MTAVRFRSFRFENQDIRALPIGGQAWFCAIDVCEYLGYSDAQGYVQQHCRPEGVCVREAFAQGAVFALVFINEGNLYRMLISRCDERVRRFEKGVRDEVLPSLFQSSDADMVDLEAGVLRRYLISFDLDGQRLVTAVAADASVMTPRELISEMVAGREISVSTAELFDFAVAALGQLKVRIG
jgi:prophage antirepressor-like protein